VNNSSKRKRVKCELLASEDGKTRLREKTTTENLGPSLFWGVGL